ncbi:hypothetical protein D3C85_1536150 [compost metagenome]
MRHHSGDATQQWSEPGPVDRRSPGRHYFFGEGRFANMPSWVESLSISMEGFAVERELARRRIEKVLDTGHA